MSELNFKGKEFVYNHHLSVPFRPLVMDAEKGIGEPALDGNLIVHGDNLHALKALLPLYAGEVDCVVIDPPYNTGNEGWCYNDNVNAPMIREWRDANPGGIEDGLRHDKWCGGPIPPEIGKLASLRYLDLTGSGWSGAIPPKMANLVALQSLKFNSLGYARFTAPVWSCPAMTDTFPLGTTKEVNHGGKKERAVSARVQGADRRAREGRA